MRLSKYNNLCTSNLSGNKMRVNKVLTYSEVRGMSFYEIREIPLCFKGATWILCLLFLQISAFCSSDSYTWTCFPQCTDSSRVIMYLEALGGGFSFAFADFLRSYSVNSC